MLKVHWKVYLHTGAGFTGAGDVVDQDVFGPACRQSDYCPPWNLTDDESRVTCGNCRRIIKRIEREGS